MQQHTINNQLTPDYTALISSIWADWEPWLRRAEDLLRFEADDPEDRDALVEFFRTVQYRAHTAAEFIGGSQPPVSAFEVHEHLVLAYERVREAMVVVADRIDGFDFDGETRDLALQLLASTRHAYEGARTITQHVVPFAHHPHAAYAMAPAQPRSAATPIIWGLAATCAVLVTVLVVQVARLSA